MCLVNNGQNSFFTLTNIKTILNVNVASARWSCDGAVAVEIDGAQVSSRPRLLCSAE